MRYTAPLGIFWNNVAPSFLPMNRNKYFIGLDVRKPRGKELFLKLVSGSDVIVENFKAGTMDKWGIGYFQLKEVNPKIIYLACSGFGQWGSQTKRPSYDATGQAEGGMSSITGFPGRPPLKIPIYIGDYTGALFAAIGVLVALYHCKMTGKGQFIDVAQGETLIRILDWTWLYQFLTGKVRERSGNRDMAISPAGVFKCRDGYTAVAAASDEEFQGLCAAMGRPELSTDQRFKDPFCRLDPENAEELSELIAGWAADRSISEVDELGTRFGFACSLVTNAAGFHNDLHLQERGAVWEIDDELYGNVADHGPAPKMSETPGRIKWLARPVGFHNEYVFTKILRTALFGKKLVWDTWSKGGTSIT